ncbi:Aminopeptidase 2 mitochondrial [Entophlyctis luteolus]|nr:Aminopeptidase 2 mitochondrial [Entophlyctis luteolus]
MSSSPTSSVYSNSDREVLPKNLAPFHYELILAPNFESFSFSGSVAIWVNVIEDTSRVVLNSKNLTILKSTASVGEVFYRCTRISFNHDNETAEFDFEETLKAGSTAVVNIEFTGIHNEHMAGFYKSAYTDADGNKRYLVVTQFEPSDCRQAFPSFDEPSLKATFDCTLIVPAEMTALSNMNEVLSVEFENSNGKKVKEVTFARSPPMSTYLVAFCVGELEYIETTALPKSPSDASPVPIRLFTVPGLVNQGKFALELAARLHEFYSEYFDIAYPLPKSDFVAIPDFGAGAMENWGLVTFRNVCLLCDSESATVGAMKYIAEILAHEISHHWIGNLVTMDWWNDLWLNEGFATFIGHLSISSLYPEWDVWTGFINSEFAQALSLDSLRSSHPVDVEVDSATEVMQIFDNICYSKGASIIRMLHDFIGSKKFMEAVRTYLQAFKFKNVTNAELWEHMSSASGEDVLGLMQCWTMEAGYPLIAVESQVFDESTNSLTVTLSQSRFLAAGGLLPEEDTVIWRVPLTVMTHLSNKASPLNFVLSDKRGTITFPFDDSSDAFWKLNCGASGIYRVKYMDEQVQHIVRNLETAPNTFSVGDRIMFLSDAMALTNAGAGWIRTVLEMIDSLAGEESYEVLSAIAATIQELLSIFYLEPAAALDGLRGLGRKVFSPKVAALGFDFPSSNEDHFTRLVRGLAIKTADACNDEEVQAELRRRFDRFAAGETSALHPEIRTTAFASVLRNSAPESMEFAFATVLGVYLNPSTEPEAKVAALRILGVVNSSEHVDRLLNELMFDRDVVRPQDFFSPLIGFVQGSKNPGYIRPLLREWFKNKWDEIYPRFKGNIMVIDKIFELCYSYSIGPDVVEEITTWVDGSDLDEAASQRRKKETSNIRRTVGQVLESVTSNTNLVQRERDNLMSFFV